MAMSTILFAVAQEVIDHLKSEPSTIMQLESKDVYSTYLWTTIPYFLNEADDEGDDEEDDDDDDGDDDDGGDDDELSHPLANVLSGTSSVECENLECGAFYVFDPSDVETLSKLLAAVKPSDIKKRILEAELEEVYDGEVWEELEQQDLSEPEEVAKEVLDDVKRLKAFYADAVKNKRGLVGYTT
jgi:hypothetical protein